MIERAKAFRVCFAIAEGRVCARIKLPQELPCKSVGESWVPAFARRDGKPIDNWPRQPCFSEHFATTERQSQRNYNGRRLQDTVSGPLGASQIG